MRQRGLTLIELVVVISMLAVLIILSLSYINPFTQLDRAGDARRKEDISQIKTALDSYYNDHGCYPTTLPFGSNWSENSVVYMREIPQDPDCTTDPNKCYVYKYSGTCPQWNVVFTKLSIQPVTGSCQLASSCVPSDYSGSSWSCVISGDADCTHLTSSALSSGSDSSGAAVSPIPSCSLDYSCSGNPPACNIVPVGSGQYCDPSFYGGIACNGVCN